MYVYLQDIAPEQELLVWYGPSSHLYMGIPFTIIHDQVTEKQKEGTKCIYYAYVCFNLLSTHPY